MTSTDSYLEKTTGSLCRCARWLLEEGAEIGRLLMVFLLLQGKAGDNPAVNNDDDNDGAGSPLFTFVDENIFKKETFLGECSAQRRDD